MMSVYDGESVLLRLSSGTGAHRHGVMVDAVRIWCRLVRAAEGFSSTGASFKLIFDFSKTISLPHRQVKLRHTTPTFRRAQRSSPRRSVQQSALQREPLQLKPAAGSLLYA